MRDSAGRLYPLGATVCPDETNFSILPVSAGGMQLDEYDDADDRVAARIHARTGLQSYLALLAHCLCGIKPGQLDSCPAVGPISPTGGLPFDAQKVLIDPYGQAVSVSPHYSLAAACEPGGNTATSMKGMVADPSAVRTSTKAVVAPLVKVSIHDLPRPVHAQQLEFIK